MARVDRLTRIGAAVKLSLSMPDGETVTVQMSKTEMMPSDRGR